MRFISIKTTIALFLTGLLLFVFMYANEARWFPPTLEPLACFFYSPLYVLCLPIRALARNLFTQQNHHWPWTYSFFVYFLSPVFFYGVFRFLWRRWKKQVPVTDFDDSDSNSPQLSRRTFLYGGGVAGAGLASTLLLPQEVKVRQYEIAIRNLPVAFHKLRLAHISDTHYGAFISSDYLHAVMEQVNALQPDLVLLTGDYVHGTPNAVENGVRVFEHLHARYGVVGVLGNHDHWEDAEKCRRVFDAIRIPLLDNRRLFLTSTGLQAYPDTPEKTLCIAGLADIWGGYILPEDAFAQVPENMPRIVLAHNPDTAELLSPKWRVDLMCCGHTHGGQVSFPFIGAPFVPCAYGQKYLGGLCHSDHYPVIVSRGVGMWGLPFRFRVPPEIGLITLLKT